MIGEARSASPAMFFLNFKCENAQEWKKVVGSQSNPDRSVRLKKLEKKKKMLLKIFKKTLKKFRLLRILFEIFFSLKHIST
jgi:hypothetical protein